MIQRPRKETLARLSSSATTGLFYSTHFSISFASSPSSRPTLTPHSPIILYYPRCSLLRLITGPTTSSLRYIYQGEDRRIWEGERGVLEAIFRSRGEGQTEREELYCLIPKRKYPFQNLQSMIHWSRNLRLHSILYLNLSPLTMSHVNHVGGPRPTPSS